MVIYDPTQTAESEFMASMHITSNLTDIICRQERSLDNYDKDAVSTAIKEVKVNKSQKHEDNLTELMNTVDNRMKRILQLAQEKGVGSWLTTIPTIL